jgi:hypothetical protein
MQMMEPGAGGDFCAAARVLLYKAMTFAGEDLSVRTSSAEHTTDAASRNTLRRRRDMAIT